MLRQFGDGIVHRQAEIRHVRARAVVHELRGGRIDVDEGVAVHQKVGLDEGDGLFFGQELLGDDAELVALKIGVRNELPAGQLLINGDDGLNGHIREADLHRRTIAQRLVGRVRRRRGSRACWLGGGNGRRGRRHGSLELRGLGAGITRRKQEQHQQAGEADPGGKAERLREHYLWILYSTYKMSIPKQSFS